VEQDARFLRPSFHRAPGIRSNAVQFFQRSRIFFVCVCVCARVCAGRERVEICSVLYLQQSEHCFFFRSGGDQD
jgi:hypothetical protein